MPSFSGEVAGFTGDGTNDGPVFKLAHVSFSMCTAGTEIIQEASDIILIDDNGSSIVMAIMWGRWVNDAVRNFLQSQTSTKITTVGIVGITLVSTIALASYYGYLC